MKKKSIFALSTLSLITVLLTQVSLFVTQPMDGYDGETLVLWKSDITNFIDSADAICEREIGYVNLLCRFSTIGTVIDRSTTIVKLPFSQKLYDISTDDTRYNI